MPYRKVTYLEQIWYLLRFKLKGGETMAKCKGKSKGKGRKGC